MKDNSLETLLTSACDFNGIALTSPMKQQCITFLHLLNKWNRLFNLTALSQPKEMIYLHLMDSLVVAPHLKGNDCLDVGSGAGFPGIPLAIFEPHRRWVLIDKNGKKVRFLTQAIAELKLSNVSVYPFRAQDFNLSSSFVKVPSLIPSLGFDTIISRALGSLEFFVESTQHLLSPEGIWVAMKGLLPTEEMKNLPPYSVVEKIEKLNLKNLSVNRHVICIRKMSDENNRYH